MNYGAQYGPVTSEKGLVVDVETIRYARYVRFWSGGSNVNNGVHFLEFGIKGAKATLFTLPQQTVFPAGSSSYNLVLSYSGAGVTPTHCAVRLCNPSGWSRITSGLFSVPPTPAM